MIQTDTVQQLHTLLGIVIKAVDKARFSSVQIKDVAKKIGAKNMSFGKPELLAQVLGVIPGAVTPFAAINAGEHKSVRALEISEQTVYRCNHGREWLILAMAT